MANLQRSPANACYWKDVWKKVYAMRNMRQLCDVTILSKEGTVFKGHSIILASGSTVFHAHFIERSTTCMVQRDASTIQIIGITSDILQVTLDFIYGVTPESITNFKKLQKGSEILGIPGAKTFCTQQIQELEQLAKENDIGGSSLSSENAVVSITEKCPSHGSVIPPPGKKEANLGKCPYFNNRGAEINYFVPLKKRFFMKMLTDLKKDHINAAPGQFPQEEAALNDMSGEKSADNEHVLSSSCSSSSSASMCSGMIVAEKHHQSKESKCAQERNGIVKHASSKLVTVSGTIEHQSKRNHSNMEGLSKSAPKVQESNSYSGRDSTVKTRTEQRGASANQEDESLMEISDTFINSAKELIPHHIPDLTFGDMGVQCPHLQKLAGHVDMEADFPDDILTTTNTAPLDLTHMANSDSLSKGTNNSVSQSGDITTHGSLGSIATKETIDGWFVHPDPEKQNSLCSEGGTKVNVLGPISTKSNANEIETKRSFSADNINDDFNDTFDQFTPNENEPDISSNIFNSNSQILPVPDDVGSFSSSGTQIDMSLTSQCHSSLPTYADTFAFSTNRVAGFVGSVMQNQHNPYQNEDRNDQLYTMSQLTKSHVLGEHMLRRHDYANSAFSGSDGSAYLSPNTNPPSLSPNSVSSCSSTGSDSNILPNLMSPMSNQRPQSNPFTPFAPTEMNLRPKSVNSFASFDRIGMDLRPQSAHQYSIFDQQELSDRPQSAHSMGAYDCMDMNSAYQGHVSFNRGQFMGSSTYNPMNRFPELQSQLVKPPIECTAKTNQYSIKISAKQPGSCQYSTAFENQNQLKSCPTSMEQAASHTVINTNGDYRVSAENIPNANQPIETEREPVTSHYEATISNHTITAQNESSSEKYRLGNTSSIDHGTVKKRTGCALRNGPAVKTETRGEEEAASEEKSSTNESAAARENEELREQLSQGYEDKVYRCLDDTCTYMNKYMEYVLSHMYHRHGWGSPDLPCDLCDKAYFSRSQRKTHVKQCHERAAPDAPKMTMKAYPCEDCGEVFKTAQSLQTHQLKLHGKGRLFSCTDCDFKSPRKKDMQGHMISQHDKAPPGVRVFACTHCSYKCIDKNRFSEHEASHSSEKNFPCSQCDNSYSTKRGLRNHLKYHSTERPHACSECGATFKVRAKLRDHVKLMHINKGQKPYQCGHCTFRASVRGNVNQHIRNTHKGLPVQVVDTQQNMRRHVKDYDYANLSGDGIEEVKDASASGYAAKGK